MKNIKSIYFDFTLFALLSFLAIFLTGYEYGVGDQIIHIPYIKNLLNPELYPGDTLLSFMKGKPTFFWEVFIPIFKLLGLEKSFFVLQFVSAFLFFLSIKQFTQTIFDNMSASYIAVFLHVIPKFSFGFSSLFVASHFIPRNLTVPLLILLLVYYIKGRKRLSMFLIGLVGCLHILSAVTILTIIIVYEAMVFFTGRSTMQIREKVKSMLWALSSFTAGLLPLLILKFSSFMQRNSRDLDTEYASFYKGVLIPFYTPETTIDWYLLINAILIILFSAIWLYKRSFQIKESRKLLMLSILTVSTGLVAISILSEALLKTPLLIQLQLGRSGNLSLLVFTALLAKRISQIWAATRDRFLMSVIIFSATTAVLMAPVYLVLQLPRVLNKIFRRKISYYFLLPVFVALALARVIEIPDDYGIEMYHEESPNYLAQVWLRENIPVDATILSPFYIGGRTEPDFRVISERTNIITNADVVEAILNVNMVPIIRDKINALTGGRFKHIIYENNLYDYYEIREYYHTAVNENIDEIKAMYSPDYIVIESDRNLLHGELVYTNSKYKIYRL